VLARTGEITQRVGDVADLPVPDIAEGKVAWIWCPGIKDEKGTLKVLLRDVRCARPLAIVEGDGGSVGKTGASVASSVVVDQREDNEGHPRQTLGVVASTKLGPIAKQGLQLIQRRRRKGARPLRVLVVRRTASLVLGATAAMARGIPARTCHIGNVS